MSIISSLQNVHNRRCITQCTAVSAVFLGTALNLELRNNFIRVPKGFFCFRNVFILWGVFNTYKDVDCY